MHVSDLLKKKNLPKLKRHGRPLENFSPVTGAPKQRWYLVLRLLFYSLKGKLHSIKPAKFAPFHFKESQRGKLENVNLRESLGGLAISRNFELLSLVIDKNDTFN